jgi:hypothetical protein
MAALAYDDSMLDLTSHSVDIEEDESWHVLVGPGDVRVVSLDQLNDMYRLDLIDEQTMVWQDGMQDWRGLGEVLQESAGDEELEEEDESWHVLMGPSDVRVLSLDQLNDLYRLDLVDDQTMVWRDGMAGWLALGDMLASGSAVYVGPVAIPRSYAPAALAPLTSTAPFALSVAPREVRGGGWERVLYTLALAAGLVLTLQRNDVLFGAAHALQRDDAYLDAEKRVLGGPAFGTARGVEALIQAVELKERPVKLPMAVETTLSELAIAAEARALAEAKAAAEAKTVAEAKAAAEAKLRADAAAKAAADAASAAAKQTVADALSGKKPVGKARPATATGNGKDKPLVDSVIPGGQRSGKKRSGDEYDPLNAAL